METNSLKDVMQVQDVLISTPGCVPPQSNLVNASMTLVLLFMLKGQKGSHPLRITLPAIGKNRFFSKFWTTSDWK